MIGFSRRFAVAALASLVLGAGCSAQPGDSSGPTAASTPVIDQPTSGQALITGTMQPVRWHGGQPGDLVDIEFVPPKGAPVTLAKGVANTGAHDVPLHLLGDDIRGGGQLRVRPLTASSPQSVGTVHQGLETPGASPTVKIGALAGFSWTGSVEEYYWIDLLTGEKKSVGTVGDLKSWVNKVLAVDYDAGRIYILGWNTHPSPPGAPQKLYILDTKTGALVHDVAVDARIYQGLKVTKDHRLIGFAWNEADQKEEMVEFDTGTGSVKVLGRVGDLHWWQSETAYEPKTDTMYVLGLTEFDGPLKLYSLNATSGELLGQKTLSLDGGGITDLMALVLNSADDMVGFRWNGSAEEALRIDPKTAEAKVIGTVGDMKSWSWSGLASINLTTDAIYVVGLDAKEATKLYTIDSRSGKLLGDIPIAQFPTDGVLVY